MLIFTRYRVAIVVGCIFSLLGCSQVVPADEPIDTLIEPSTEDLDMPEATTTSPPSLITSDATFTNFGYTYNSPDGNRYVEGQGGISSTTPIDIELSGDPVWLVSARLPNDRSIWAVVLEDGQVQLFELDTASGSVVQTDNGFRMAAASPIMIATNETGEIAVIQPPAGSSQLTHPILLDDGHMVTIAEDGDLVFALDGKEVERLAINAMLDARIVQDGEGRLAILTDPTTAYAHGVLGNSIEAGSLTVVDTNGDTPTIVAMIDNFDGSVIEGIAPIWADLDGDGSRELIVTLADSQRGARISAFTLNNEAVYESAPIGQGNRWRHQLAVAPFDGEPQLVDVLTPHLGRTVEFFAIDGNLLSIEASINNYTSHLIGSPNLDTGVAGDFDGDGQVELLIPNGQFGALAGLAKSGSDVVVAYDLATEGAITTNLSVTEVDGGLQVGVGTRGGKLRIWP